MESPALTLPAYALARTGRKDQCPGRLAWSRLLSSRILVVTPLPPIESDGAPLERLIHSPGKSLIRLRNRQVIYFPIRVSSLVSRSSIARRRPPFERRSSRRIASASCLKLRRCRSLSFTAPIGELASLALAFACRRSLLLA